jgi:beta-lactamase regulating signal transducer with metallopeptidase domain/DUF4097 and DUF4098 domain-containing protein YvlB
MIEIVVKVTSLLLLGTGVTLLLRWHSAAARHFVWVLVLSSALVLPLMVPIAPEVSVKLTKPIEETAVPPVPALPIVVQPSSDVSLSIDVPPPSRTWGPSLAAVLPAIWILGVVLLLARVIAGHIGLMRVARRSTPLGLEWESTIRSAIMISGIERPLRFAYSYAVGGPIAWGLRRPIVLFPPEAENWPAERMRVALLHELAHIARLDHVWQLVAQIACAIYWFHPLLWIASRAMRTESEHACDDRVLEAGMPGPDYAELLLEVARSVRAPRFYASAAVSMARSSHLEERLHAVLDDERSRQAVPAGVRAFGAAFLGLLLIPIAGLTTRVISAPVLFPKPPVQAPVVQAVAAPVVLPAPAPLAATSDGVLVRELDVDPGEEIRVQLDSGGDVHVSGWDHPRVRVQIDGAGSDWESGDVEIERASYGVRVALRGDEATVTVHVPRKFDLRLNSSGGDLTIGGVDGTFRGNTGGGEIIISKARGRAELNTGGGEIAVSDSTLDGWVNTGGGDVRVVRVQGNLRTNTGGGDVQLDEALHGGRISTGGGDIRIGRTAGRLEAQTGGGDIDLRAVAGSVRASTGAGDVRVVVVEGEEARRIDLSSGTGDVVLDLPDDFEGTFDLETSGAHDGGEIETRLPLPIERRGDAVRVRGAIGSASNVVRVRTTNGGIHLR